MGRPLGGLGCETSVIRMLVSRHSRPSEKHLQQIKEKKFIVKK